MLQQVQRVWIQTYFLSFVVLVSKERDTQIKKQYHIKARM